jgi:chromosome segregation ATPase
MDKHAQGSRHVGRRSSPIRRLLLPGALSLLAVSAAYQDEGRVDGARATLEKWVETRRVISQERRDWELGREVLDDRIDLVTREIESFRGKISEAETSIGDADRQLAELVAERDRLKLASASLAEDVVGLEARTKELLKQLPDPIRERIRPLSQRIPDAAEDNRLSLSERYQNIVGILNAVNKFNREITVTSEVRTLGDGASAEVSALYIGIGQGFYASANGTSAGIGMPGPEGWAWRPANEYAADISRAIAILNNEQPAEFVRLPIRIE